MLWCINLSNAIIKNRCPIRSFLQNGFRWCRIITLEKLSSDFVFLSLHPSGFLKVVDILLHRGCSVLRGACMAKYRYHKLNLRNPRPTPPYCPLYGRYIYIYIPRDYSNRSMNNPFRKPDQNQAEPSRNSPIGCWIWREGRQI